MPHKPSIFSFIIKKAPRGISYSVNMFNNVFSQNYNDDNLFNTSHVMKRSRSQPDLGPDIPDINSNEKNEEDEKKQQKYFIYNELNRLVRNRAAARLRRIKQKTLIESFEREIKKLEETIKLLNVYDSSQSDMNTLKAINTINYTNIISKELRIDEVRFNIDELKDEYRQLQFNINQLIILPLIVLLLLILGIIT